MVKEAPNYLGKEKKCTATLKVKQRCLKNDTNCKMGLLFIRKIIAFGHE